MKRRPIRARWRAAACAALLVVLAVYLAGCFTADAKLEADGSGTIDLVYPVAPNAKVEIEKTRWRNTLSGCKVTVYELLNGKVVVRFGPHEVARFEPRDLPARQPKAKKVARPLGHNRKAA